MIFLLYVFFFKNCLLCIFVQFYIGLIIFFLSIYNNLCIALA